MARGPGVDCLDADPPQPLVASGRSDGQMMTGFGRPGVGLLGAQRRAVLRSDGP